MVALLLDISFRYNRPLGLRRRRIPEFSQEHAR